jgi:hypothetical protein
MTGRPALRQDTGKSTSTESARRRYRAHRSCGVRHRLLRTLRNTCFGQLLQAIAPRYGQEEVARATSSCIVARGIAKIMSGSDSNVVGRRTPARA